MRVRNAAPSDRYDVLVGALGYEPRCTHVPSQLSNISEIKIAWSFESNGVLSFDDSRAWYEAAGFAIKSRTEMDLADAVLEAIGTLDAGRTLSIAVDISCVSRDLLADLLLALQRAAAHHPTFVDFWYTPPLFDGAASRDPTIQIARPISAGFAALTADPLLPVTAIIGVGYEPNLALGVAEYLDAAQVFAFVPRGHDLRFDEATDAANSAFFLAPNLLRRAEYDLRRPFELFARLESLTYGTAKTNRVGLAPLGPKMFALCALLVAMRSQYPLAVWRFSGGDGINVRPTRAGGDPVHLSVEFESEGL